MTAALRYGPPDASRAPRYTGIRTFARTPHVTDWANADVAIIGVPFDTATSMRTGARFGPAAVRDQSLLIRPWHTGHEIDVFATLSVAYGGDIGVTPGNAEKTAGQIALRWLLDKPNVATIPKASSHERRIENFEVFDFELSDEDRAKIDALPKDGRIPEQHGRNWDEVWGHLGLGRK